MQVSVGMQIALGIVTADRLHKTKTADGEE